MQELSLVEGAQRRDFAEILWQIAEKRGCDEIAIHYDCGHALRADVWVPCLPKTREYGVLETERRRFARHGLFVLTRDPGAVKCQITVPEGRCRHCNRGNRQVLICGVLQLDVMDRSGKGQTQPTARRLELPLSGHAFLASVGRVCVLPENISPPPIMQGAGQSIKPFEDPPLSRDNLRQWSRKEVEDSLRSEAMKYVGAATVVLIALAIQCLYLLATYLAWGSNTPGSGPDGGDTSNISTAMEELNNMSSFFALELGVANTTWALSALTVTMHKTFGGSIVWSVFLHPLWVLVSMLLAPVLCIADIVVAVPRSIALLCIAAVRTSVLHPGAWLATAATEVANMSARISPEWLWRNFVVRPATVLSQVPLANPMAVAVLFSLLVTALSSPQPPSLSLPSLWNDLPNFEIARGLKKAAARSRSLGPMVQRIRTLWYMRKESRAKGGARGGGGGGAPAARTKERTHANGRERADAPGRPEKSAQAGKQEGKAGSGAALQPSAPPCFVCLDRPSRYILEPCGHRVVCEGCAVQLVEAAARNRSMAESSGGMHHGSERGGGACPSCGMVITRAMRLFS